MYRVNGKSWLRYYDFMLLDIVSLQLAFVLSYILRLSLSNPYADELYRDMAIVVTLIDIVLIYLLEMFSNVMRRGYFVELKITLRHGIILELLAICYLFSTQRGTAYSRLVLYGMGGFYIIISYFMRIGWKAVRKRRMKSGGKTSLLIVTAPSIANSVLKRFTKNNFDRYKVCGLALLDGATEREHTEAQQTDSADIPIPVAAGAENSSAVAMESPYIDRQNYEPSIGMMGGSTMAASDSPAVVITSTPMIRASVIKTQHTKQSNQQRTASQSSISETEAENLWADMYPVVANQNTLVDYVVREWVDEVFIFLPETEPYPQKLVDQLVEGGVTVHINLAQVHSSLGRKQVVEQICGYTALTTSINYVTFKQALIKRLIDIVGGLMGCIAAVLLALVISPIIYIKSPGPILFTQTRIGRNGKHFKLYKFRSMYLDAEERKKELLEKNRIGDGMMFKLDYDPRIIGSRMLPDGTVKKGIGNFIRDWSIDEFPQFWNVLKSDMSLVGTRPPTIDEWEKYELHHRARLAIKPGITGMWQVSGRSNITDFEEVVKLDTQYISEWSFALDMRILWKTFIAVFRRDGSM